MPNDSLEERRLSYAQRAGRRWPYALLAFATLGVIGLLLEGRWNWTLLTRALSLSVPIGTMSVILALMLGVFPERHPAGGQGLFRRPTSPLE